MTNLPSISRRKHYRTIPGQPSEPTSTLVLTSPRGYYVDIRINKYPQPSSDPRTFDGKLQWAFAGTKTSIEKDGRTISTWHHPIDSLSENPKPDVGEMTELENGDVLEKGETIDEDTGVVTHYEELWEELVPHFWSQDSWRKCVVLKTLDEDKDNMGMAIRCGSFSQGILKRKEGIMVEQWDFVCGEHAGRYERVVRLGEGEMPCEGLLKGGLGEMEEGERVCVGGVEWVVVEVARWIPNNPTQAATTSSLYPDILNLVPKARAAVQHDMPPRVKRKEEGEREREEGGKRGGGKRGGGKKGGRKRGGKGLLFQCQDFEPFSTLAILGNMTGDSLGLIADGQSKLSLHQPLISVASMSSIKYIPSQNEDVHKYSERALRIGPLRLLLKDLTVFFTVLPYLPLLFFPLNPKSHIEKPKGPRTFKSVGVTVVQTVLGLVQTVLLILLIPAIIALPGLVFLAVVLLCILIVRLIAWFTHGPRILYSVDPTSASPTTNQHPNERWVFINGIGTGSSGLQTNIDCLSCLFGRQVLGIHNRSWGIFGDILECLLQRCLSYKTLDVRVACEIIKEYLVDTEVEKLVLVAHSQGGIIASLVVDTMLMELPDDIVGKLEIYTFGSAASHFHNPPTSSSGASSSSSTRSTVIPYIEHYANEYDMVPRWGVLYAISKLLHNRYAGNVFIRDKATGHLFVDHYLGPIFPVRKRGNSKVSTKTNQGAANGNGYANGHHSETTNENMHLEEALSYLNSTVDVDEAIPLKRRNTQPLKPLARTNDRRDNETSQASPASTTVTTNGNVRPNNHHHSIVGGFEAIGDDAFMEQAARVNMATALLLIDLQNDFLSVTGAMAQDNFLTKNPNLQSNVSTAISHFRAQQGPVIWICSEYPATELPPIWPTRPRGLRYADVPMIDEYLASSHHGQRVLCASGSDGAKLYPDLNELKKDDKVFVKQYYSAFTNTGLAEHLRSNGIVNVVIAGVSATNCVLAAAADAFFNEFEVFVLEDCVGASSEELKSRAMEKMRYYGRVVSDLSNIPVTNGIGMGPAPQQQAQDEKDKMVLYYVNGSIPSWRVMMMLAEYNIPYTAVRLKVMSKPKETRSAAFARTNPRCKTPTLVDGGVTVTESMAILQYIERKYKRSRSTSGERTEDGEREEEVDKGGEQEDGNSWITTLTRFHESENAHFVFEDIELLFHPLVTLSTHHLDRIATAVSNTEAEMALWEHYLATDDFVAGDEFTIADSAFYPCLAYLEHRGWAFEGFLGLKRYAERVGGRECVVRVWGRECVVRVGGRECAVRARPEGWLVKGRDLWGRAVGVRERKGDGRAVERGDKGDEGRCGSKPSEKGHPPIPYFRLMLDHGYIPSGVREYRYPGSGTETDPFLVEWTKNDSRNPMNTTQWRKWSWNFLQSLITFAMTLTTSGYSAGPDEIYARFGPSMVIYQLGFSVYVLGFGLGPLIWAPLSECYGRQLLFFLTLGVFTALNAASIVVPNTAGLVLMRFIKGSFGSSLLANAGGVVADIFEPIQRGLGIIVFSASPLLGPVLGPVFGGLISQYAGYQWLEGFLTLLSGILWIVVSLAVPETYTPLLLERRAQRLTKITGQYHVSKLNASKEKSLWMILKVALTRPWVLLFWEPIVLLLSVYMAVLYGTLYLFFAAFPIVFREYRGWDETHTGLAFLGIGVGVFLGIIYSFFDHAKYAKLRKTSDDELGPEARLPESLVGCIAIPTSLFWFAWTITPSIHFMVPLVGSIPFGFGFVLVYISTQNYLVDAYTIYAASVLAANTLMRSTLGAAFPLFTHQCIPFVVRVFIAKPRFIRRPNVTAEGIPLQNTTRGSAEFNSRRLVVRVPVLVHIAPRPHDFNTELNLSPLHLPTCAFNRSGNRGTGFSDRHLMKRNSKYQVLDISFRAVKECREIYNDGYVAAHRDAGELAEALARATGRLNASQLQSSAAPSQENTEILNLSRTCTTIAHQLQTEITKLNLNNGGHRQVLSKAVQSIRKAPWLKETQAKLNSCTRTLDTLILIKLDTQSLRSSNDINTVDQRVRDLALRIERGRITTDRLLANQTSQILDRFDQRFDGREGEIRIGQARERFQASLFFPDINAREDEIDQAFEGTCKWIFDPPTSADSNSKKWHNFREWLQTGQDLYWINGKPGAGKSTLMRYIVDEPRTAEYLSEWEPNKDLIIATFFFKNLGSELQKSTTGLLRSLIWQLVRHWPEMIHLVLKRYKDATGQTQVLPPLTMLPTWTEKRLLQIVKDFANEKPATVTLCVFIDGLDEYVGDQDTLLHIIGLLSSVGGCKVCVSSRPDQTFCTEFQGFPQCRVQDLNQKDIEKMVHEKLKPCLEEKKPNEIEAIKYLIIDLILKAEGVFLWLSIMIKDLIKGSKCGDSVDELHQRLKITPNTMNGLYRRILRSLDKMYLDYALKTFQIMLASERLSTLYLYQNRFRRFRTLTLLEFACMDEASWTHVEQLDRPYFCSSIFSSRYRELNIRLNARCGNLIDIKDNDDETEKTVLAQHGRTVDFIHRTAVEFLKDEYVTKFSDISCLTAAWIPLARAKIGLVLLFPLTRLPTKGYEPHVGTLINTMDWEDTLNSGLVALNDLEDLVLYIMMTISLGENTYRDADPRKLLNNVQSQLTAQILQTLHHLTTTNDVIVTSTRSSDHICFPMKQLVELVMFSYIDLNVSTGQVPSEDSIMFAAFWGCESYIRFQLSTETPDGLLRNILLSLIRGAYSEIEFDAFSISFLNIVDLLYQRWTPRSKLKNQGLIESAGWIKHEMGPHRLHTCRSSPWGPFLFVICHKIEWISRINGNFDDHRGLWLQRCLEVVEKFLSEEANHNARIGVEIVVLAADGRLLLFADMTPLGCVQIFMQMSGRLSLIKWMLESEGAVERLRYRYCWSEGTYYRIKASQSKSLERLLFSPRYPGDLIEYHSSDVFQFNEGDEALDILREIVSANNTLDADTMEKEWTRGGEGWLEEEEED
ncbi:MAG: hypothetical protein Q9204_000837 [Flavoplaca sp. TL-2023a]